MATKNPRKIYEIADDISKCWPNVSPAALPYLQAMMALNQITDKYVLDSAEDILIRFLANAQYWRGEDARRIKAEINALLGN